MAICEEEAKIRAELEKEIEKDLEEEMRENISRLIRKLEQLHMHLESQTQIYQTNGKSRKTISYRDQTEFSVLTIGGKHFKRPAKIADRKDSEKKFKRVNLDKDFDWVRSLRSGSSRRHELKGKYTIAATERARKCRSVKTRPLLMSGSGNEPPLRGRRERNNLVFIKDVKAIHVPLRGKGKSNAKANPKED